MLQFGTFDNWRTIPFAVQYGVSVTRLENVDRTVRTSALRFYDFVRRETQEVAVDRRNVLGKIGGQTGARPALSVRSF